MDSHAAGNLVASQPSDYLVTVNDQMMFIEAKSSTKQKRFQRSMLRPAQRGAIIHYGMGMGVGYLIIFEHLGRIDVLRGTKAMNGKRINYEEALSFSCKTEDLEIEIIKRWKPFPISKMIDRIKTYE